MVNTFIALGTDESLHRYLSGIIDHGARELPILDWADPASIHFTLAFLDELNDVELSRAMEATRAAAQAIQSFTFQLKGLSTDIDRAQLNIRMKVGNQLPSNADRSSLQQMYRTLCLELERRQLKDKNKEFIPHLSLARTRQKLSSPQEQALQRLVQSTLVSAPAQPYSAKHLAVMQSERSVRWPKYTCLGEYAFAPGIQVLNDRA